MTDTPQDAETRYRLSAARRPTARCRCTAASATPATSPFEHIYRHHRRYRITEGSEEIQMRKVAAFLFGFMGPRRAELAGP